MMQHTARTRAKSNTKSRLHRRAWFQGPEWRRTATKNKASTRRTGGSKCQPGRGKNMHSFKKAKAEDARAKWRCAGRGGGAVSQIPDSYGGKDVGLSWKVRLSRWSKGGLQAEMRSFLGVRFQQIDCGLQRKGGFALQCAIRASSRKFRARIQLFCAEWRFHWKRNIDQHSHAVGTLKNNL